MKQFLMMLTCSMMSHILFAQAPTDELFLQAKDRFYVILKSDIAFVYTISFYFDKHSDVKKPYLNHTDTLTKKRAHSFVGTRCSLTQEKNTWYLTRVDKKKELKMLLDSIKDVKNIHYKLNDAYYLATYFKMTKEIRKLYPLSDHHYTEAYHSWDNLPYKYTHYLSFRKLADNKIDALKHTLVQKLEQYESLKKFVTQNAKTASYETLRDTLSKLSSGKGWQQDIEKWRYYLRTVHEIAEQRPEFFFRLAADLPDNQHDIFFSVDNHEKALLAKLKLAEADKSIKKKFFKEKRRDKISAVVSIFFYVTTMVVFWGWVLSEIF